MPDVVDRGIGLALRRYGYHLVRFDQTAVGKVSRPDLIGIS